MKCLKHNTTGEIKRLSEERATELVASGNWQFIPKKEWKLQRPVKDFNRLPVEAADNLDQAFIAKRPKKVPGKKSAYREEQRRKRSEKK